MNIQSFDTFRAITTNVKYFPYALAAYATSISVGIRAKMFSWETVQKAYFPENDGCGALPHLPMMQKMRAIVEELQFFTLNSPFAEEVLFRGILQEGLLTRAPRRLLNLFKRGHWVDSTMARIARVLLSATAFSAYHLPNQQRFGFSQSVMNFQLATSFGLGLVASVLKEKTGSIWPGITMHMTANLLGRSLYLISCTTRSGVTSYSHPIITHGTSPIRSLQILFARTCHPANKFYADQANHYLAMAQDKMRTAGQFTDIAREFSQLSELPYFQQT